MENAPNTCNDDKIGGYGFTIVQTLGLRVRSYHDIDEKIINHTPVKFLNHISFTFHWYLHAMVKNKNEER